MLFEEYNLTNNEGKSNCVIRSLCKILNKTYDEVYNGLLKEKDKLNSNSFNDIEVFESYMKNNNILEISNEEIKIKDLKLDSGLYIIFCYDKSDYYHMIPIINNTIYDKNNECLELYVLKIYKKDIE